MRGNEILRSLDRGLGRPLLWSLSLLRRKRRPKENPERIGLLCLGAIGDLVLFSACVRALKARFPGARLLLCVSPTNADTAALVAGRIPHVSLSLSKPLESIRAIRRERLDVLVDAAQWPRISALYCAFSKAYTIGFRTHGQHRHYAYDKSVEHRNDVHELENFENLLRTLGVGPLGRPQLRIEPADQRHIEQLDLGKFVVLHAWPSGVKKYLKMWPNDRWVEVAKRLLAEGYTVVLTGAPADAPCAASLAEAIGPGVVDLSGKLSLKRTAALLRQSRCVMTVNTGIMHIAAACDVPLVCLHGPTSVARWGPVTSKAVNVVPRGVSAGYLNLGFEYPRHPPDSMGGITVSMVVRALEKTLALGGRHAAWRPSEQRAMPQAV